MNLRALRRRQKERRKEKTSQGQKRRRLGVAGDPPPPPPSRSSDRLLMAVCSGDADDIRKAIDDDTEAGSSYVTPEILNCACATGNALAVRILLERSGVGGGTAIDSTDGRGEAAVHSAVRRGSTDIIRALIEYNADINAQTKYERKTPLHLATGARKLHVLRFLLSYSDVDVHRADIYGSTPLHVASEVGFSNGADVLLQSNANPDVFDRNGWTPLHVAAANGHASIVERLIGAEAGVDRQNQFGRTPLHWACSAGHTAVVRLLLRHGASVEIDDKHGKRATDHAATDEIRRLVDAGAEGVRFSVLSHLDSGAGMNYSTGRARLRRRSDKSEEEEEDEEEEDSPFPGGPLKAILDRESAICNNHSTWKRREVISERPSMKKSSFDNDFKKTSDIGFTEKSTEVSQLEDSGSDDKESEQRLKPRSHDAEGKDHESHKTTTISAMRRVNILRSKNAADDSDDDDDNNNSNDDGDEKLSRNVKSVLDRMSFPSENETTLDDFVQRLRDSSSAYIDSFSNSLKHLMHNPETTKE